MKDKQARVLAIVALAVMVIFIAALIATLVDYRLLNGAVGYIALGSGVFVFMIFLALKADGRGYSLTKMKNDAEMEQIEKALEEQVAREKAEKAQKTEQSAEPIANAEEASTADESSGQSDTAINVFDTSDN